ncbi:MAG: hypothetical protein M1833_004261 [Piccolia ochrophora]|nr:MAG: hypothetical protein M1833_004261 [Piccolia ochrophora]
MPQPGAIPAPLPPSVEAAYRNKCVELKRRTHEVDEANDAYRLRKVRLTRGILKLRLERAFLLEQLAKRTSANVEDSEGSPSPPPTPKEKPLRTKRGHRRPTPASPNSSPLPLAMAPLAPTPPLKPHRNTHASTAHHAAESSPSGTPLPKPPKRPANAYMLFTEVERPRIRAEHAQDPEHDMPKALALAWREMDPEQQKPWFRLYDDKRKAYEKDREEYEAALKAAMGRGPANGDANGDAIGNGDEMDVDGEEDEDDDVEGDGDGDGDGDDGEGDEDVDGDGDGDGEGDADGEENVPKGGFTAVNR